MTDKQQFINNTSICKAHDQCKSIEWYFKRCNACLKK